ncbi:hypothetical protein L1987_33981 [Smallanthus sonchifolius]|uniref:Uncharacterized protein n=1 Tax=Smallanthus sonchifolius TaxID=185202 RepID=A0ACB9HTE9_9ASTR|nr:hypothetical protein L1987_33981 [Smallanthus sonchifolius]
MTTGAPWFGKLLNMAWTQLTTKELYLFEILVGGGVVRSGLGGLQYNGSHQNDIKCKKEAHVLKKEKKEKYIYLKLMKLLSCYEHDSSSISLCNKVRNPPPEGWVRFCRVQVQLPKACC